jgi:hypothetical protein
MSWNHSSGAVALRGESQAWIVCVRPATRPQFSAPTSSACSTGRFEANVLPNGLAMYSVHTIGRPSRRKQRINHSSSVTSP